MSLLSSQVALRSLFGASIFIIAKFLRLFFFIFFIVLIGQNVKSIGGYSLWQMILFYATFNLVDVIPQFLFREVYRFSDYIRTGSFDFILIKPVSPLFRSLLGGSDILDTPILFLSLILTVLAISHLNNVSLQNIFLYLFLLINGFLIALAFHIFTLCIGVMSTRIDHTVMIYRDLTQMGRLPVDIYLEPIKTFLTFVIPIAVMMTFPVKALLGILTLPLFFISILISFIFLISSVKLWSFAINKYQSASS